MKRFQYIIPTIFQNICLSPSCFSECKQESYSNKTLKLNKLARLKIGVFKSYASIIITMLMFSATNTFSAGRSQWINLPNTPMFYSKAHGPFYIPVGSFRYKSNANLYQKRTKARLKQAVFIQKKGPWYVVLVGPLQTSTEVRAVGNLLTKKQVQHKKETPKKQHVYVEKKPVASSNDYVFPIQPYPYPPKEIESNWLASIEAGAIKGKGSEIKVNNGSMFPDPFNQDRYTTTSGTDPLIGFTAGRFWKVSSKLIESYSLGLRYQHLFAKDIGGQIIQYQLPQFTNYRYHLDVTSDDLLAAFKVNLFLHDSWLPYISAGAGCAFNRTSGYSESALPSVTPRLSPSFSGKSSTDFTYTLGTGIDYRMNENIIFSLGYEFHELGSLSTGQGKNGYQDEHIELSSLHSSALILTASYLFGN